MVSPCSARADTAGAFSDRSGKRTQVGASGTLERPKMADTFGWWDTSDPTGRSFRAGEGVRPCLADVRGTRPLPRPTPVAARPEGNDPELSISRYRNGASETETLADASPHGWWIEWRETGEHIQRITSIASPAPAAKSAFENNRSPSAGRRT